MTLSTNTSRLRESITARFLFGGSLIFDMLRWVIGLAVLLALISTFIVSIFIVDGESMEPNLHDKELVLYSKGIYSVSKTPERGDVVVVRYPGDPENKRYVKRVVGLPNEKVTILKGRVLINDTAIKELYLNPILLSEPDGEWQLGSNDYFIMGDNRPNSNDSRYFGPVEKRFISGKAVRILYPRFLPILDY